MELTLKQRRWRQVGFFMIPFLVIVGIIVGLLFLFGVFEKEQPVIETGPSYATPQVTNSAFVLTEDNKLDVALQFFNPNERVGIEEFTTTLSYRDSQGVEIYSKAIKYQLLPAETIYVTFLGQQFAGVERVANILPVLSDYEWKEMNDFSGIALLTTQKEFSIEKENSVVKGVVSNRTAHDIRSIRAHVLLFDDEERIIAMSSTTLEDLRSQAEKAFQVTWFGEDYSDRVKGYHVSLETNYFSDENLKTLPAASVPPPSSSSSL